MNRLRAHSPHLGFLLVGILLISANTRAPITSVGPVIDDIAASVGLTSATAGILASVPLIAFGLFSPVAPIVAARAGLERTLWCALVLLAFGIVARSLPLVGAIWVGTALLGAAIAFMNVLLPSLVKRDFPDRVAGVTGAYTTTQSVTAAIASGIAVPIAGSGGDGWRLAVGIWAGFALIAAGFFLPQLRGRSLPIDTAPSMRVAPIGRSFRSPWTSAMGWQITAFMGLQSLLFYVVITWLPSIESSLSISGATAGFHLFIFQIVAVIGNVGTPLLVRKLKDQRPITIGATLLGLIAIGGILLAPQLIVLWVVIGGLGSGSTLIMAITLFGLRTRDHRQTAVLSGMAQSLGYLLAASGPIVIGALHDASGGWRVPLIAVLVALVIQCGFAYLAGRTRWIG